MLKCPSCQSDLEQFKGRSCIYFNCPTCHGRSATVSLLRKKVSRQTVNSLWLTAKSGEAPLKRLCPDCKQLMSEVMVVTENGDQLIDVCVRCQFVWFDSCEYDKFPLLPEKQTEYSGLSQEARECLAFIKTEQIAEQAKDDCGSESTPDEWWHWIPGLLGMPIEHGIGLSKLPLMTWSLVGLIVFVSLCSFSNLYAVVNQFGLIPVEFGRYCGGTLISSFFIHGSLMHLIGNMYFLLIFGDDVEDYLGKRKFLLLLFVSALVGGFMHILIDPSSTTPCIGASGGISGIITFYGLAFPKMKVSFLIRVYLQFRWIKVSAFWLFVIWGVLQLSGLVDQVNGLSNVSAMAHIGGALSGWFFFWMTSKKSSTESGYKKSAY